MTRAARTAVSTTAKFAGESPIARLLSPVIRQNTDLIWLA
jgi:hypothetical protein